MTVDQLPEWVGASVLAAIITALGWVGKQLAEWHSRVRTEDKVRRAKLAELLALVSAGDAAWHVQCDNRDSLAELINSRKEPLPGLPEGYDNLFAAAFSSMSKKEAELHAIVRSITIHTFRPLNESLLEWLAADVEYRVHQQDETARGELARYLMTLEVHLLLWRAKYEAWIPEHPDRALVYLADEEGHGVAFPQNGTRIIRAAIPGRHSADT